MFLRLTISHSLQLLHVCTSHESGLCCSFAACHLHLQGTHFISSLGDRSRIIPSLRCPSMVSWASLALYFADAQRHWECYRVTGSSKKQPFCIQSSCVFHLWNAAGFWLSDARSTCRMRMKISCHNTSTTSFPSRFLRPPHLGHCWPATFDNLMQKSAPELVFSM